MSFHLRLQSCSPSVSKQHFRLLSAHLTPLELLYHLRCCSTDACHPAHIVGVVQQGTVRAAGVCLLFVARYPQFSNLGHTSHSRLKRALSQSTVFQGAVGGMAKSGVNSHITVPHGFLQTATCIQSRRPRQNSCTFDVFFPSRPHQELLNARKMLLSLPSASASLLTHFRRTPCTLSRSHEHHNHPHPLVFALGLDRTQVLGLDVVPWLPAASRIAALC
ncbi:hypothetical protein C8R47DRAFT_721124 [Mycena vitilis]|nr:hypothetical protein C8R47DRAFT_721124 [Mycena vitilis]